MTLNSLKKIIIHDGEAHLDDFALVCFALAHEVVLEHQLGDIHASVADILGDVEIIRTSKVSPEDLEDTNVLVADVGGVYDASHNNFDHHQQATTGCAYYLYAVSEDSVTTDDVEYSYADDLSGLFPWFCPRSVVDNEGPYVAARRWRTEWEYVEPFLGPCEDIILRRFAGNPKSDDVLDFTEHLVTALEAIPRVRQKVMSRYPDKKSRVTAINFLGCEPSDVEACKSFFLGSRYSVEVTRTTRNDGGIALKRLANDLRVDFNKIKDDPRVVFVHRTGFYAQLKDGLTPDEVDDLIVTAFDNDAPIPASFAMPW